MARKFTRIDSRLPKMRGRSAVLTPKEAAVVEAVVLGANQTEAVRLAGYSDPVAHSTEIISRPIVAAAIEERRSAAMQQANIDLAHVYRNLAFAGGDREPEVRSSMVRANEIILKAAGELGPDVRVNVDARSVILPAVDADRAAAAYASMFLGPAAAAAGLTDGGTEPAGGG